MPRQKKPINEGKVAELALLGASVNEIALSIGVDDQTLHRRFAKLIAQKKAERRVNLRRWQTEQAEEGNPTMLVWLGKNELDQTDRSNAPPPDGTVVVVINRPDATPGT